MTDRALVVFSGGMDSAAALWWAKRKGWELWTLGFLFPARPKGEIAAARRLAARAGVARQIDVPLDFLVEIEGPGYPAGYLPKRNLVYYAIAASVAERAGARWIVGGHLRTDFQGYPDASEDYFRRLQDLLDRARVRGRTPPCGIVLPLIEYTKMELILVGREWGVPFAETWSCFADGPAPCGRCFSCVDRRRSWEAVGIADGGAR